MCRLGSVAVLGVGLVLSGCSGPLDSLSASSSQNVYSAPGYYGTPVDAAQGYYPQPYYAAPYSYQPGYAAPYPYQPSWSGQDGWREHESHERRERAFQNEGRQSYDQQRQDHGNNPHIGAQPRSVAPIAPSPQVAAQPPPSARSQVDQNRKLIDQLGFRPSR